MVDAGEQTRDLTYGLVSIAGRLVEPGSPARSCHNASPCADRPRSVELAMGSVIIGGARTPIGKLLGGFKDLCRPPSWAGTPSPAALERSGVAARDMSTTWSWARCCRPAPGRSRPGRPRSKAGIAMSVPALTINKVCLSGLNAVALADQLIRAGECEVVVAGGMESMTSAPHLLPKSRTGLQVRQRGSCSTTWPTTASGTLHRSGDGGPDRDVQHRRRSRSAGPTRTPSPPGRTSGRSPR